MKKLDPKSPYFLIKFFTILLFISILGVIGVGILEHIFGIVIVFYSFVSIVAISGIVLIIAQIKQRSWNPKIRKS